MSSVEPLKSGFDGSSESGLGATLSEGSSGLGEFYLFHCQTDVHDMNARAL